MEVLEVIAPTLSSFEISAQYLHGSPRVCFGENMSSLSNAVITLDGQIKFQDGFIQVLRGVYNAKSMQLFCPKLMISEGHTYEDGLPTPFYNLKWLKLDLPYGDRYKCHYREPHNIKNLLERFPNLETLVIDIRDPMSFNLYIDDWKTETLQFSMHHLKSVEVRAFSGQSNEVGLLKFLLDAAVVLEKAVIVTTSVRSLTDHEKLLLDFFTEEIKSYPRASSYAEILFK